MLGSITRRVEGVVDETVSYGKGLFRTVVDLPRCVWDEGVPLCLLDTAKDVARMTADYRKNLVRTIIRG